MLCCVAIALPVFLHAAEQSQPVANEHRPAAFDIPSQPLSKALQAFSAASGIDVLTDARRVGGAYSHAINGDMDPSDALDTLLIGSGLVAEEFSPNTVMLHSIPSRTEASPQALDERKFIISIQRSLLRYLCGQPETLPGRYRLALKLWIGRSGKVLLAKRLDTTGDGHLDAAVDQMIPGLVMDRPPPKQPQPIALIVSPRPPTEKICAAVDAGSRQNLIP